MQYFEAPYEYFTPFTRGSKLLVIIFTPVYAEDAASLVERAKALQQAGQSPQAKPLYEQAAALGSSEAHFMLSYSYSLPLAEDIAHLSQAARAGHPKAFYYLTDRLLTRGAQKTVPILSGWARC